MITIEDVTLRVIDALNACGSPYMLVGSFSSNLYGIPRSTKDADFVLQLESDLSPVFYQSLGNDFEIDPQLKFETNTGTFKQEMRFQDTPFTVELFRLSDDPFDRERFRRRVPAKLFGRPHVRAKGGGCHHDEGALVQGQGSARHQKRQTVQRGKLDWPYIENWGRQHGTLALLEEIRRSVPEI